MKRLGIVISILTVWNLISTRRLYEAVYRDDSQQSAIYTLQACWQKDPRWRVFADVTAVNQYYAIPPKTLKEFQ